MICILRRRGGDHVAGYIPRTLGKGIKRVTQQHPGVTGVMLLLAGLLLECGLLIAGGGCRRGVAVSPGAVRIMPLGDSITQGERGHPSYRRSLWFKLKTAGYEVDFVGGLKAQHSGGGRKDFDRDHEGHWGWPVEGVLDHGHKWFEANIPDIVLLHMGTNDLLADQDAEGTVEEIAGVLVLLRRQNPKTTILLSTLIPLESQILHQRIAGFNDLLKRAVPGLQREQSRVILVDQFEGFSVTSDLYDGIHPNEAGAEKIAHKWFAALEEVLGSPSAGR